ncbi:MAG TPA: YfhO family protein [Chloroflexota bacterium]|nr:YfhO family protein [Chloroflexota bacterium]
MSATTPRAEATAADGRAGPGREVKANGQGKGALRPAQPASRLRRWRVLAPDLAALALFLVLPWLRFWRLFTPYPPDQMTLAEGDFNVEFFPLTRAITAIVHGGQLPLWNPWSDAGQPLLADPQSAIWYPLNWVLPWLVTGHDGASLVRFEAFTVFHLFLAATFMYLLARRVIGSRFGALVAALVFAYSGLMTAYPIQQVPIVRTAVWMPLLLLCLIRAFEGASVGWAVLGAGLLAVDVFAGHPQLLLFQLYGLTLYVAFRLWQVWPNRRAAARTIGLYALFGVLGFALAAVQVLPSYEFMRLSDRASGDYAFTAVGFTPFELLMDVVAPRIIGGVPPYIGILPLLLAFLAVRFVRRPLLPYWVLLATLGLVVSLAGNTFFHSVLYLLGPGYALFQHQERAIYLYTLAMALLAGYGAAWLARPLRPADRRALGRLGGAAFAGVLAALVVAGVLYVGNLYAEPTPRAYRWADVIGWYNWFVFMLLLALALLALRRLWRRGRAVLLAALPAAILLDVFTVSWSYDLAPRAPDQIFVPSQIVDFIGHEPGTFRVADYTVLNGNHGLVYLIPTVDGTYGMFVERYMTLRKALPRERFNQLLNVRYEIARDEPAERSLVALEEPFQDHMNRVVRVPGALERATVVPGARVVPDDAEQLAILAAADFDPRREVLLAAPPPTESAGPPASPGAPVGQAVMRQSDANHLEFEVSGQAEGSYLLLSEVDFPGWRAEVDGAERPVLRADYALRAVPLHAGDHIVRLSYEPGSLRLGALITLLAAVGAAALLVWWSLAVCLRRRWPARQAGALRPG